MSFFHRLFHRPAGYIEIERGRKGPNHKWYLCIRSTKNDSQIALVFGSSATRDDAWKKARKISDDLNFGEPVER